MESASSQLLRSRSAALPQLPEDMVRPFPHSSYSGHPQSARTLAQADPAVQFGSASGAEPADNASTSLSNARNEGQPAATSTPWLPVALSILGWHRTWLIDCRHDRGGRLAAAAV